MPICCIQYNVTVNSQCKLKGKDRRLIQMNKALMEIFKDSTRKSSSSLSLYGQMWENPAVSEVSTSRRNTNMFIIIIRSMAKRYVPQQFRANSK